LLKKIRGGLFLFLAILLISIPYVLLTVISIAAIGHFSNSKSISIYNLLRMEVIITFSVASFFGIVVAILVRPSLKLHLSEDAGIIDHKRILLKMLSNPEGRDRT